MNELTKKSRDLRIHMYSVQMDIFKKINQISSYLIITILLMLIIYLLKLF